LAEKSRVLLAYSLPYRNVKVRKQQLASVNGPQSLSARTPPSGKF
jgi:hypothetical protein